VKYQFGTNNFSGTSETPISAPSSNAVSGLGNSFSVTLPAYTMAILTIPMLATNSAPTLAAIGDYTVNVGQTVGFTASATDTDTPPQTLTFSLLSAPANATLNTNTGAFSWQPWVTDAHTTNPITLKVADSGIPSLSATQSFRVIVNPLTRPTVSAAGLSAGQFTLQVSNNLVGPNYAVQGSTNLVDWSTVFVTNSPGMPFFWTDVGAGAVPVQFYRVVVGPPL
jgi:hypothetical protein